MKKRFAGNIGEASARYCLDLPPRPQKQAKNSMAVRTYLDQIVHQDTLARLQIDLRNQQEVENDPFDYVNDDDYSTEDGILAQHSNNVNSVSPNT